MKMPVAYLDVAARYVELAPHLIFRTPTVANLGSPVGLYLEQPWVGLTDEEIHASKPPISNDAVVWELAVEWAEAKLKEKNT
jgi:hypothetical protein